MGQSRRIEAGGKWPRLIAVLAALTVCAWATQIRYVSMNAPCVVDRGDKPALARALRDGDGEAIEGMIARGKALKLLKGTQFEAEPKESDGFTWGYVHSGREVGRSCHIPTALLQDSKP